MLKRILIFCVCLFTSSMFALDLPYGFPNTNRQKLNLNVGWQYHRGDAKGIPQADDFDDAAWESVNLPHTYQLTSINMDDCDDDKTQPTFHRDISWYRKSLKVHAESGQKVFLEFEGAHQVTDLWVNGRHAGQHAVSAYTPFHFDVTDYVRSGQDNIIALRLDNRRNENVPPDGHKWDYVLFGGLYRDVYLVVTDPLHVTFPWEEREAGVFVTTPSVNHKNATVSVRTTVRNDGDAARQCRVVTRVLDAEGELVFKLQSEKEIQPGTDRTFLQTGGITENMRLWHFDDPYLYRVNTQIVDGATGDVVDMVENPLGLRWFELRPGVGFCMNGEPAELVGANRHQQYPYIGDAVPDNLHWNDALKFKKAGMNIIRLAHYPHDDAFFDACDALGILICEEPPTWIEFGPPLWMDRLEESFRRTIRNHRNHPSVWGWGAGINHRGPVKRLQYASKEEDPTRITMNNGTLWTGPQHSGITDLYAVMDYRGAVVPEKEFLFAMEHSGSPDTRGLQHIVSRYKGSPERIGLTLWSAHDNYSFHKRGKTNPNLSVWSAACWDAFRLPKPAFYWYQSEMTTEPMIHIPDSRAQKDSLVVVLSNCDEVELLLNGKSLGKRGPVRNEKTEHLNSPSFEFPVVWTEGKVKARGIVDGEDLVETSAAKPGRAHHLEIDVDQDCGPFYADGSSIFMVYARVCDKNGNPVPTDTTLISFEIKGPGKIVGDASIGANPVVWEFGTAPLMVQAGTDPGTLTITAKGQGLKSAKTKFQTRAWTDDVIALKSKPIYEPFRMNADIGAPGQHIEEDWTGWGTDKGNAYAAAIGDVDVAISAEDADLSWHLNWGVPGDLSFMIEDGIRLPAGGTLKLELSDVREGRYRLKTWHHVLSGDKADAPVLNIQVVEGKGNGLVNYSPTFGKKIKVSGAGVGGKGDGGSNLGAAGFACQTVEIDTSGQLVLKISSPAAEGIISLNGFELKELIQQ